MKFNFTEWKSCVTEPPKTDGEYLVIGVYNSYDGYSFSHASNVEYTVEFGWNTNAHSNKHAIDYGADSRFEYFWSEVSIEQEAVNEELSSGE